MRRAHIRFLGTCLVIAATAASAGAQSRTRTVATSGGGAPGGGVFAPTIERVVQKGLPSIEGSTIVFGSDVLLNGQTVYGLFSETNGVLRLVTRVGAPAPGGGTIQDITHFTADRLGNVVLTVRTGGSGGADAVLRYQFGVLSALVHAKGDFDGTKEIVAATGLPSPGGGTFGAITSSSITSSTSGLVAFTATVDGGPGGVFTGLAGNLFHASDAVDAAPNITLADNADAEVSYTQPSSPGIKTVTLTGTIVFVANGTPAPRTTGTINFGAFQVALAADDEGSLFFFAPVTGDSKSGAGLFRRDRFTNQITSIALQGDPASGSVSGVLGLFALVANLPARIANDDGKVVFVASAGSDARNVSVFTTLGAPEGLVPTVSGAAIKGTKLTVTGASFESGARILVNGNPLSDTKNNKKNPTTKLTSKSGVNAIPVGGTVSISVMNPTGAVSAPFSFTRTQ
jgi:hypothetical protein